MAACWNDGSDAYAVMPMTSARSILPRIVLCTRTAGLTFLIRSSVEIICDSGTKSTLLSKITSAHATCLQKISLEKHAFSGSKYRKLSPPPSTRLSSSICYVIWMVKQAINHSGKRYLLSKYCIHNTHDAIKADVLA